MFLKHLIGYEKIVNVGTDDRKTLDDSVDEMLYRLCSVASPEIRMHKLELVKMSVNGHLLYIR